MKPFRFAILALFACVPAFSQEEAPRTVLKVVPPETISARAGSNVKVALTLQVDEGYHVNSNAPADSFLIPMRLTWSPGALASAAVTFPKPEFERLQFSEKPVSVFKGTFEIATRFKVPSSASPGPASIAGKLHYQACNNRMCLPPKTIDISVPVEIVK